jgi:hypothetical protein
VLTKTPVQPIPEIARLKAGPRPDPTESCIEDWSAVMVCANRAVARIRELDAFRTKLGLKPAETLYEVSSENELRWSLEKFLVEDHDLRRDENR